MGEKNSTYNILVALVAAISSLSYGYAISILGSTLSKPAFYEYMGLELTGPGASHTETLVAVWNCLLYIGALIGCSIYPWCARTYGRRVPIAVGAVGVIIGGGLQAGCVNSAMLAVARVIIGLGIGNILPGVPLYQAEVSPPHGRGLMVGLHASLLGAGTSVAQWIGVAFFHIEGQVGWRVPLAFQCLFPAIFLLLIPFLPESPRYLYTQGKHEQAEAVLVALHGDPSDSDNTFAQKEMLMIKAQIDFELENHLTLWQGLKAPSIRHRFILGWLTMAGTQFTGLLVILTYQQVIYGSLGFGPFMITILSGIWTIFNGGGNFLGALIVDKVGRKLQMMVGYASLVVILTLDCVLTLKYGGTTNKAGNTAATFFIFLTLVAFTCGVEAPAFVYTSEIFPTEWRGLGVAWSMSALFVWSIIFTAIASPAFANIGAHFYIVFIVASFMMLIIVFLFFPETKGYTLEELSAVFGDEVVNMNEHLGNNNKSDSGELVEIEVARQEKLTT